MILLSNGKVCWEFLSRVGTAPWELFNENHSLAQVHATICERFMSMEKSLGKIYSQR